MILYFLLTVLNTRTPKCDNTSSRRNELSKKSDLESKALWSSILLDKSISESAVQFDSNFLIDNRIKPDFSDYTKSENIIFHILNYDLQNREIHDMFNSQFISNVIINIFNPNNNKFASDYVRFVLKNHKTYPNLRIINNNVISLITDKCSFEWAFSKILCRNSETINLLESLFCKKNLKNMSPKKYVDLIYEHIDMWESKMNLFVVYFEIIKHLNNIAETNIYYYELCGISAYLFSQLSMFTSYRASLNINSFIPRSAELEMKNMQKSMLILYYCVRLVEFSVKSNVNCFNHTINDLIYRSLKQINDCSFNLIFKIFDCIKKIRLMFQKQPTSKLTMKYFKYFRCYILPFSVYSEKYINDISLLLSKTDYCPIIEDFELFCDIEGFYKLTTFLVTK